MDRLEQIPSLCALAPVVLARLPLFSYPREVPQELRDQARMLHPAALLRLRSSTGAVQQPPAAFQAGGY